MPLFLIATPLGRGVALTLAVLALLAGIYIYGGHAARRADSAAADRDRITTMEQSNAAAAEYRDDGAVERLRRGSY